MTFLYCLSILLAIYVIGMPIAFVAGLSKSMSLGDCVIMAVTWPIGVLLLRGL